MKTDSSLEAQADENYSISFCAFHCSIDCCVVCMCSQLAHTLRRRGDVNQSISLTPVVSQESCQLERLLKQVLMKVERWIFWLKLVKTRGKSEPSAYYA